MQGLLLLSLFFFTGCSSPPTRAPSALASFLGEVSPKHSSLKLLSVKKINGELSYFFYFQARDEFQQLIDIDPGELSFVQGSTKLPLDYFSDSQGRYYYRLRFIDTPAHTRSLKTYLNQNFWQELPLQHQQQLKVQDISQSTISLLDLNQHTYGFELELKNSEGRLIDSDEAPESDAHLIGISPQGPGRWQGELRVVDSNTIIYLSLRLNSSYLPRLPRIQHIEK